MQASLQRIEQSMELLGRMGRARGPSARRATRAGVALAGAEQRVLGVVVEAGPIRISEIARRVAMGDAAVSRVVRGLEDSEFVMRVATPEDGRVALIRALPAGRLTAKRLRRAADAIFEECLDGWSARDLDALARLMERLTQDLGLQFEEGAAAAAVGRA